MLWVEPSAACNLDCPECPTAAGRQSGQMRLADFTRILDQSPWLKFLNLWHRGEPLAAADFPDMVEAATRRGIYTQTHSNGILLSRRDLAERLVEARLGRVAIGVDGSDEATYLQIRHGGSLAEVEAGIRALVDARRRRRSKRPRIIAECLLSRQPPEQFRTVKRLALEWGCDEVKLKTFRVPHPEDVAGSLALLPDNRRLWRYELHDGKLVMKRSRSGCRRLTYSAVVAYNGEVYPCCFWVHGFMGMGNCFSQPLVEVWRGDPLRDFQRTVAANRDSIPMCRNCTEGLGRLYVKEGRL